MTPKKDSPARDYWYQVAVSTGFYALLLYTLLMLLPVNYQATLPYLDSSWGYALNYLVHSEFHFGPDVIFTYGPLGFLNNPQHVGNDIPVALAVRAFFWIALGVQLLSIWRSGKRTAATVFCISLVLAHILYYDYWDYNLIALSLLTVIRLFRSRPSRFDLCLLPMLLAVTFLLKFTAFLMVVCMLAAYTCYVLSRHMNSQFITIWLGVCYLSGPLSYLIYDHSVIHLAQYCKGMLQISTGFARTMSLENFEINDLFAAILCAILCFQLALGLLTRRLLWSECVLIVLVTWGVFRHGFIRGGYGDHSALFFGLSISIFACLFMAWKPPYRASPFQGRVPEIALAISLVIFDWIALSGFAERYPVLTQSNWWPGQSLSELEALFNWDGTTYNLDHGGDDVFAALPGMAFRDSIQGRRVMVFPNSTPYVAKIRFEMFPIYALQAYSAYTPYLDLEGAKTLSTATPPVEKIILEWNAIDGRNPMLDTPAMYMTFLGRFMPEQRVRDAILLRRREHPLAIHFTAIDHQPFKSEAWVNIPERDRAVAFSIRLNESIWGAMLTNLYRQEPVYLELCTRTGTISHFRVPPQVLSTPGLISYVPNSLDELEALWSAAPLKDRNVRIRLVGLGLEHSISDGYEFYQIDGVGANFSN